MMVKPGITELDKCVDSRYTLVSMVAKRARIIGKERMIDEKENEDYIPNRDKAVTQAVNEIADGVVGYIRSEAIERAKVYEIEKFNAISQMERESIAEENEDKTAAAVEEEKQEDDKDMFGDATEVAAIDQALRAAMEDGTELDDSDF